MTFDSLQRIMHKKEEQSDDLLCQALHHDWPLIAVLSATTKQYQPMLCWIVWLVLSSDFNYSQKFKSFEESSQSVILHCLSKGFVRTLRDSFSIFAPSSPMKVLSNLFEISKSASTDEMETTLKQFIVELGETEFDLSVVKGKNESIDFSMQCLVKHLQMNFKSTQQQAKYLKALCKSKICQFNSKFDFLFLEKVRKVLENTNLQVNFEELCGNNRKKAVEKITDALINDHRYEKAIEVADLLNLPKSSFVFKWMQREDENAKIFEEKRYLRYMDKYMLSIENMLDFIRSETKDLEPCAKKFNMMKFSLRNSMTESAVELDKLEYEIILLYVKLQCRDNPPEDLSPLLSEYYEAVISKEKSIIHNSLYELKSIAKVDELTISHMMLEDAKELEELDKLMLKLLDAGDIVEVLRIQEMFGRAPEDLKLLVYMMSIAENINSIYDIAKEERKMISSLGVMSKAFNRLALRSIRTSSFSKCKSSLQF